MMIFIKRTWLALFIFLILPIVGLLIVHGVTVNIEFTVNSEFWRSVIISISTSLFATGIIYFFIDKRLHELSALDDEIEIMLDSEKYESIHCPKMLRKDFSRSEVLGYIGMIKMKGEKQERFSIADTNTENFAQRIQAIHKNKGNQTLHVKCTDKEIEQFDESHVKEKSLY